MAEIPQENRPPRWQKLVITLGAGALALIGLIFVAHVELPGTEFAELVKAFDAFCGVISTITVAAIAGNLGEHWKPLVQQVISRVTGKEPQK